MADSDIELDRYQLQTPYDILGVMPDATAREIVDRRNVLQRDINDSCTDARERAKKLAAVEDAYVKICSGAARARVDFFLLDSKLFLKKCERLAGTLTKPKTDVEGVIKPRKIRVTHEALLADLTAFVRAPQKIEGFQARPMEVPEPAQLPEPLAIVFDC